MAAFFQLLRDRIFSRSFIILQRQPVENNEPKSSSGESTSDENNTDDSKEGTKRNEANQRGESNSTKDDDNQLNSPKMASNDTKKISESVMNHANSKVSDQKKSEDLQSLYSGLKQDKSLEKRCISVLNLALCLLNDSPDVEYDELFEALDNLEDSHSFPDLAVCHALLLCAFTKMSLSLENLEMLEDSILSLTGSLRRRDIINRPTMYSTAVLIEDYNEIALKLCQGLFSETYLDLWELDISTICCCTLSKLSSLVKQHDDELGAKYCFKNSTLKYILGMTGRSTQEIVSEFMISQKQSSPSISSHRVNQCLHVLEHALSINPDLSSCASLQHESFSLPHCLTRLLGWSVTSVFPDKEKVCEASESSYSFYLSTLVCILKVLSVLTFNPHQYDSFTNVKGLMEKILICTLKDYFESNTNHFDIQILCLEMLINLYIKNQKTFVLLCLKKFKISESEEILAVEGLLKMLSDNLEKIKEVKESTPYPQSNCENKSANVTVTTSNNLTDTDTPEITNKKPRKELIEEETSEKVKDEKSEKDVTSKASSEDTSKKSENTVETDPVLLAASKDMEHSTVVSFICVLVVFFMRTKQSFKEFILSKLTSQALKEATDVSRKFLEFASLTGGMPVTGILILTQTINKLQAMQTV